MKEVPSHKQFLRIMFQCLTQLKQRSLLASCITRQEVDGNGTEDVQGLQQGSNRIFGKDASKSPLLLTWRGKAGLKIDHWIQGTPSIIEEWHAVPSHTTSFHHLTSSDPLQPILIGLKYTLRSPWDPIQAGNQSLSCSQQRMSDWKSQLPQSRVGKSSSSYLLFPFYPRCAGCWWHM